VHDSGTKEVTRVSRENFLATIPSSGNSGFGRVFTFGGFTSAAPVIGEVTILGNDIKFHQTDAEGLPINIGTYSETESGAQTNFDCLIYKWTGTNWQLLRHYSLSRVDNALYGGLTGVLGTVRREVYAGAGQFVQGDTIRVKVNPFW
jgi:hypothetical protein